MSINNIIEHYDTDASLFEKETIKLLGGDPTVDKEDNSETHRDFKTNHDFKTNFSTPKKREAAKAESVRPTKMQSNPSAAPDKIIGDFLNRQQTKLAKTTLVHALLRQVWEVILPEIFTRHGIDNEKWKNSLKLYELTLWSTQINAENENLNVLVPRLTNIVNNLGTFLSHHKINAKVKETIMDGLLDIHLQIIKGKNGKEIQDDPVKSISLCASLNRLPLIANSCINDNSATVNIILGQNGEILAGQAAADAIKEFIDYDLLNGYCDLSDMGDFGEVFDHAQPEFKDPRDNYRNHLKINPKTSIS